MLRFALVVAALLVALPALGAALDTPPGERLDAAALAALYATGFHAEGTSPRAGPLTLDLLPDGRVLIDAPGEWRWHLDGDSFCMTRRILGLAREYCMIVYRVGDSQYDAYFAIRAPDTEARTPGRKNFSFTLRP